MADNRKVAAELTATGAGQRRQVRWGEASVNTVLTGARELPESTFVEGGQPVFRPGAAAESRWEGLLDRLGPLLADPPRPGAFTLDQADAVCALLRVEYGDRCRLVGSLAPELLPSLLLLVGRFKAELSERQREYNGPRLGWPTTHGRTLAELRAEHPSLFALVCSQVPRYSDAESSAELVVTLCAEAFEEHGVPEGVRADLLAACVAAVEEDLPLREHGHARLLDLALGVRFAEAKVRRSDDRLDEQGQQTLFDAPPEVFQTPYLDLGRLLRQLDLPAGSRVVDLGAAYGRLGLLVGLLHPELEAVGYELLERRAQEGSRVYEELGLANAHLLAQDLAAPDFRPPPADVYLMYDPVAPAVLEKVLADLQALAAQRPFRLVAIEGFGEFLARLSRESWLRPLERAGRSGREQVIFQAGGAGPAAGS